MAAIGVAIGGRASDRALRAACEAFKLAWGSPKTAQLALEDAAGIAAAFSAYTRIVDCSGHRSPKVRIDASFARTLTSIRRSFLHIAFAVVILSALMYFQLWC